MEFTNDVLGFGSIIAGLFIALWRIRTWFNDLDKKVTGIDNKIDTHEAVCEGRHSSIDEKFDNVDKRFLKNEKKVNTMARGIAGVTENQAATRQDIAWIKRHLNGENEL